MVGGQVIALLSQLGMNAMIPPDDCIELDGHLQVNFEQVSGAFNDWIGPPVVGTPRACLLSTCIPACYQVRECAIACRWMHGSVDRSL
jgi:hypothetical protein